MKTRIQYPQVHKKNSRIGIRFRMLALAAFLCIHSYSTAQEHKVLIIDTLVGLDRHHALFPPCFTHDYTDSIVAAANQTVNSKHNTNLIFNIGTVEKLCLALDNKGGYFEISEITDFEEDTIRIQKWSVYRNGLPDTIVHSRTVYATTDIDSPYETKVSLTMVRHKGLKKMSNAVIVLNGQQYVFDVTTQSQIQVATYSGYMPRSKCYNKQTNEPTHNRKGCKRLHGVITTRKPFWSGRLSLVKKGQQK